MTDHGRWSRSGVIAGNVGGFAFALFLLVAGFAGSHIVEVDRPGWTGR